MANVLNTDKQIAIIARTGRRFQHPLDRADDWRSPRYDHAAWREGRTGMHGSHGCEDAQPALHAVWRWMRFGDLSARKSATSSRKTTQEWAAFGRSAPSMPKPNWFRLSALGTATQPRQTPFVKDVAARMANRVQISTDGLNAYVNADRERLWRRMRTTARSSRSTANEQSSDHRRYSQPEFVSAEKKVDFRAPEFGPDFYQLHRAVERYDPPSHAPADSAHAGFQQEAGELRGSGWPSLRLLQLRQAPQHASLHPGNGRWRDGNILERGGLAGGDSMTHPSSSFTFLSAFCIGFPLLLTL